MHLRSMAEYIVTYEKLGKPVLCSHCQHDQFTQREAQLNTAGMTFFGLDWANRSATVLVCKQCSHLEWFLDAPKAIQRSPLSGARVG